MVASPGVVGGSEGGKLQCGAEVGRQGFGLEGGAVPARLVCKAC